MRSYQGSSLYSKLLTLRPVSCTLNSFKNDRFTLRIFTDLSKAFDMVHHTILLNKLNQYGIKNKHY